MNTASLKKLSRAISLIGHPPYLADGYVWSNVTWKLKSKTAGQSNTVGWQFALPDGTTSTEEQYLLLLEGLKLTFDGMLQDFGTYGKPLSTGSASSVGTGMRELFRWMVFKGYRSFADLDESACNEYLADIPRIITDPARFYNANSSDLEAFCRSIFSDVQTESFANADAKPENWKSLRGAALKEARELERDDPYTYAQVAYRINTLYYIHSQAQHLRSYGVPTISKPPFNGRSAGEITSTVVKHAINRIPPLPDEVFHLLMNEVVDWITVKGPDFLALQNQYLCKREELQKEGIKGDRYYERLNEVITCFEFSRREGERNPWRGRVQTEERESPRHGKRKADPHQILRQGILAARDASILALQYLTGLRASEVCAIQGGWNKETGLPCCITTRLSKTATMELFFVESIVSKGKKRPEWDEWILGARPVGSTVIPLTVKALILLEKLMRPWREFGGKTELIVHFSQPKSLPQAASSVSELKTGVLLRGIKDFAYSQIDYSSLPDANENGDDLAKYRVSRGQCIRSHQGRKTFCAYTLNTRRSALRAVSEHFKHLDVATTEEGYYPASVELRAEQTSYRTSITIAFFVNTLRGKPIRGRMAEVIERYFESEGLTDIKDDVLLEEKVRQIVETHDLRIFFAEHGNCFIGANPVESRCNQSTGRASWAQTIPDFRARSSSMCAGCACFVVDASHLAYWKHREHNLMIVVQSADAQGFSPEFRVQRMRAEQAKKIVRILEQVA